MSSGLFAGALAPFAETVVVDEQRAVIAVPELLQPVTLDWLLLRVYGPELMPDKRPVLVSQFAKYYFMQIIPPVVVASLVDDVSWPLGLDEVAFALSERGVLDGVRFFGDRVSLGPSSDPFTRFGPLLVHLHRVIDALSAYGGVKASVFWSSAGDYLETCLRRLALVSDVSLEPAHRLLRERLQTDGQPNPLFNTITYIERPPRRQRRSCCLSYQVEWVGRCEHCPSKNTDL
ncbi:siderophore-iron reductase FhuF [Pseudomonas sp. NPDC090201]|uniref:siderophore-iron reductase FhuF n=1 Tax=Pseudomonas sp. NPDC090201 TaxID=3364475 RepID=UPI0038260B3D